MVRARVLAVSALLIVSRACVVKAQPDAPMRLRTGVVSGMKRPVRVLGDLTLCGAVGCEQAAGAGLELAPLSRWWISAEGSVRRNLLAPPSPASSVGRVDVFYGTEAAQVWIGRGAGEHRASDSLDARPIGWLESGAALRWRSVSVAIQVGSGTAWTVGTERQYTRMKAISRLDSATSVWSVDSVPEIVSERSDAGVSRWSSTEVRLGWQSDHWRLGAILSRALAQARGYAVWSRAEAERRIGRDVALLASVGTFPRHFAIDGPRSRWTVSAGLTAATGLFSREPLARAAPGTDAESFLVLPLGPERYRIVVRLGHVTGVELASDLTGWRAVAMQPLGDDRWSADVPATSGAHRVSIRADGGPWAAPPGLVGETDDFGGSAGMFVIP